MDWQIYHKRGRLQQQGMSNLLVLLIVYRIEFVSCLFKFSTTVNSSKNPILFSKIGIK